MTADLLSSLADLPHSVFSLFKPDADEKSDKLNYFNELAKSFLDPIAKTYLVLDEVYIDGLDSTQVFGQSRMILDGVGETLMSSTLPDLQSRHSAQHNIADDLDNSEAYDSGSEQDSHGDSASEIDDEEELSNLEIGSGAEDENELSDLEIESGAETLHDDVDDSDEMTNASQDEGVSDTETKVAPEDEAGDEGHKLDAFGLNDGFFDIDDFNKQILAMEDNDEVGASDEEDIDYFKDLDEDDDVEDDEAQMAYYDDFYEKPNQSKKQDQITRNTRRSLDSGEEQLNETDDLNEEEYDNAVGSAMLDLFADDQEEIKNVAPATENLSSFEKQQQAIQAEIRELEAELIAEKKWTMKGEVRAKDRPRDSLLDDPETTTLEFDRTAKPVPVITQEVTETIEDLIRRRIKSEEFDDLPRRFMSDIKLASRRQRVDLSEQKSKKSLAELYEDDYKGVDAQLEEASEEVKKQHDEIAELFAQVSHRLDAMCSAHYIPKPHQFKTIDITVNDTAASINMEDAQPLHVSSESRLAPQEIYKIGDDTISTASAGPHKGKSQVQLKSGLSYSKDELERDDKQRLRRANKRKRSKAFKAQREEQEARDAQDKKNNPNKRARVGDVVDTLSKAKNVTIIGKKGERTDVKGVLKKDSGPQSTNNLRL